MKNRFQFLERVIPIILGMLFFCGCASNGAGHGSASKSKIPAGKLGDGGTEEELEGRVEAQAHYAAGLSFDLNDLPDKALDEFFQSAMIDPRYEPGVLEVSRRLLRAQKTDKAIELLQRATSVPENPGSFYAWLGLAYAQAGKTNQAIAANQKAIKKMPDHLAAYLAQGAPLQNWWMDACPYDALNTLSRMKKQEVARSERWIARRKSRQKTYSRCKRSRTVFCCMVSPPRQSPFICGW